MFGDKKNGHKLIVYKIYREIHLFVIQWNKSFSHWWSLDPHYNASTLGLGLGKVYVPIYVVIINQVLTWRSWIVLAIIQNLFKF